VTFGDDVADGYDAKGDLLAYTGADTNDEKVYLVNLKTNEEWLIQQRSPGTPGCFAVATDGKRLAYSCHIWTRTSSGDFSDEYTAPLQLFDPATNVEQDLHCFGYHSSKGSWPHYLGFGTAGIVATMALPPSYQGQLDAFFHRFSDGQMVNLTQKYGGVWYTRASGSRLVWTEVVGSTTQIVLYDTATGTKKVLDPTGKPQFLPRIEGDKVVWVDHRNAPGDMWNQGNSDIYLQDLVTGKTVAVTTNPARQSFPDVWGDWVVWEDWRNNPNPTPRSSSELKNADIFARNMKTGQEVQLSSLKGMEIRPIIDQHRVFFQAAPVYQIALFEVDLIQLGY